MDIYNSPEIQREYYGECVREFISAMDSLLLFEEKIYDNYLGDINVYLPSGEAKIGWFDDAKALKELLMSHQGDFSDLNEGVIESLAAEFEGLILNYKEKLFSMQHVERELLSSDDMVLDLDGIMQHVSSSGDPRQREQDVRRLIAAQIIRPRQKLLPRDRTELMIGASVEAVVENESGEGVRIPLDGEDTRMGLRKEIIPSFIFSGHQVDIRTHNDRLRYVIGPEGVMHLVDSEYADGEEKEREG